jgi:hypothetical protein
MRPGQGRIDCQCARRAVERRVQFQSVMVNDTLVVQAKGIARRQDRSLPGSHQRLVKPAQSTIYLADIAQVEWCGYAMRERSFHVIEGLAPVAHLKRHDAGQVQCLGMVWRDRQNVIQQMSGIGQAASVLVFTGDAEHLSCRHGNGV